LDDNLAEAHTSLAFVLDLYDWDWESAEQEYKRAIALNPGYATAHVFAERDDTPCWDYEFELFKKFVQDTQRLMTTLELKEATQKLLIEQSPHVNEVNRCVAAVLKMESGGECEEEWKEKLAREGSIELALASLGDRITIEGLNKEIECTEPTLDPERSGASLQISTSRCCRS
jgi:hypothetical protein